jgi:gliding motility-associated-like protein
MFHLYPLKLLKLFFKPQVLLVFLFAVSTNVFAQCPPNIDFELGDFSGWQCWVGSHYMIGTKDTIDLGTTPVAPTAGRHQLLSAIPGNGFDPYGGFPQNCPNGSGYSIKLGNTSGGAQAEGVSYTFTIPPGQDKFSLIYNYAVVFQDPGHLPAQQPQLRIEIKNITDNQTIGCSSFSFIATSGLPGFFQSPNPGGPTPVWCKNWSATSINLDGNAGKTIRLFFKTADCTFSAHFGYAYIDVNTECSSAFTGATFCPDDTLVNVTAPFGYQSYKWFNNNFTQVLGNSQVLTLNPPPLSGDSVFVELTPYSGYGCLDTLAAKLWDTLSINAFAGTDKETCDNNPVQIGSPPEAGRVYKWVPATGLSDPNIANPMASPSSTTNYTLTVTNSGGGCATQDEVKVDVDILSDSIQQIGPSSFCTASGQSVLLKVLPHDSIQWYRNGGPIAGATTTDYAVTQSGDYYAVVFSSAGCTRTTVIKHIDIWESPVIGFSTAPTVQCFTNNLFTFINSSTLNTGTLQYTWDMGDGNTFTTRDVTHTYSKEGSYSVKLLITAPGGCADSSKINVLVNPSPTSAFSVDIPEQCFKNNWFVFNTKSTVSSGMLTYTWDFGDGNFDNSNDIAHRYAVPDTFLVRLTATETNGGCADDSVMQIVVHPSPVADFSANNYNQCFPGHNFIFTNNSSIYAGVMKYLWTYGDGKSDTAFQPSHIYSTFGKYTIKLLINTPAGGCTDSLLKDVELYPVPDADFSVRGVCQDIRVPVINRTFNNSNSTVNYYWDFGDGHLDNAYTPAYNYTQPGPYIITLKVSTAQCPVSFNSKSVNVDIERMIPGITYPDKDAAFNYAEQLQARSIGSSVIWSPPDNLNNRFSYSPVFKGTTPQLYTLQLKTAAGCVTVDTQLVKTHKKIEIYVPTGFTPGNDYLNERLRPVLIGFTKVNYFRIYDRWGKLLFTMNSDQPGWDGRFNGNPVNMQTVVWMIEAVDVDGNIHRKQGTTVVIR